MKILIVDDEPVIIQIVTRFLTSSTHHEVQSARSAQAALEAISNADTPFDCFLVDIQMPEVDGIDLIRMIRETPGFENTPIIMLTAMREKHYLDRAFSAGATDYVGKPFDGEDLKRRLQDAQHLSLAKTRQQDQPVHADAVKGMGDELKEIALDDPIPLPGVQAAVDYAEFENYARQLLRRKFFKATTVAVKLEGVDRLYAECTTTRFVSRIRVAATAVQEVLLPDGGILSYRGNGIFLCIPEKRLKTRRDALQTALNARYLSLHPANAQAELRLLVGDQVPLSSGSDAHALDCLARAVDSLESQPASGGDNFNLPGRLLRSRRLNDEQKRLEKRAFEYLLRETLAGPENDAWERHLSRRGSAPDNR